MTMSSPKLRQLQDLSGAILGISFAQRREMASTMLCEPGSTRNSVDAVLG